MTWETVDLLDMTVMPSIAYGSWGTGTGQQSVDCLKQALFIGFRHIDTAQNYSNEEDVGRAIKECGVPREEIYVTTKWSALDDLDIPTSFRNSLKNLGLSYIDLYLIHWPYQCRGDIEGCWKELEKLKDSGLVKSIGLSNFEVDDMDKVLAIATYKPVVNQIRFHPYIYEKKSPILEQCAKHDIVVESYASLSPVTTRAGGPVDKAVEIIAKKHSVSGDQVLLAWIKAKGVVPVTTSVKKERLRGYFSSGSLVLTDEEIRAIDEGARGA